MNGKISVIIPVYNVEKYLVRCLQSILDQTYSNLEIIVVNDGSTDTSPHICEALKKRDRRISVVHQNNNGVSNARNTGISQSTGDYISFIDADDYIEPNYFQEMTSLMQREDADISTCSPIRETSDGTSLWKPRPMHRVFNTEESICALFRRDMYCGWPWNKLFKSKLILNSGVRFDETLHICEDLLFNFHVFSHANRVVYDSTSSRYHYVENSMSVNLKMKTLGKFDIRYLNRLDADLKLETASKSFSPKIQKYCSANSFISNENILHRMRSLNCFDPALSRQLKKSMKERMWPFLMSRGFGSLPSKVKRAFFL